VSPLDPSEGVPIEAILKRLDREWFARRSDARLELLVTMGEAGLPVALGLLVNGAIIRGTVGHPRRFAEAGSRAIERAMEAFYATWDTGAKRTAIEALRRNEDSRDERRQRQQQVVDHYYEANASFNVDDVALEDIADVTQAIVPGANLTFEQATLQQPGQPLIHVGTMQVSREAIDSWWMLDEEEGAQPNYVSREDAQ
jgi:hypothetical protein